MMLKTKSPMYNVTEGETQKNYHEQHYPIYLYVWCISVSTGDDDLNHEN